MPPLPIEEYQVGWVCALPKELTAARAMLDEEHEQYKSQVPHDNNSYVLGRIHGHNVVIACLPAGVYGTVSAATVANNMLRTFPAIRFGLMVGIGGGIPNSNIGVDIRLGDVVVSQPDGTHGGVVQYDLRKNLGDELFERKGVLRPPPTFLLTALTDLQSRHQMYGNQISETLSAIIQGLPRLAKVGYVHPGLERDILFCSNVEGHKEGNSCTQCQNGIVDRESREDHSPEVHYGVIASGNELMKNVVERDRLGREFGAKCVEMEAAGLMNDFPCIVVRGICDYADSHKNDVWQEYAAVTAAGLTKELLSIVKPAEVTTVKQAIEVMIYNRGLNLYDAPDMSEDLFIGRQTEIQQMESILQPQSDTLGSSRKRLILGGMGGIGKTQLAIHYAKRRRTTYSSVFWLNATSEATLKTSLRRVAVRTLPPDLVNKLEDDQVWTHVDNWLSEQNNTRWLLIFDNHDDQNQYDITKYYPSVAQGSIIITTRTPDILQGEPLKIQHLTEEGDSLRVLASRSGRPTIYSDPGSRLLARRLNGFPLALATAGAFLKQTPVDCTTYLQRYEEVWQVSRTPVNQLPEYSSRTLYTTWNLSLARIQDEMPQAAKLLAFLAYLDHQDIWYELLRVDEDIDQPPWLRELTSDKFMFMEATMVLTRYCLVETHHETDSYSLHTCVHDWTLDGLNREIDWSQYWLAFDCVASNIRDKDWARLSEIRYQRFVGHAIRLVHDRFRQATTQQDSLQTRFYQIRSVACLLREQVQYSAAEQMQLRALAGMELALGPDHTSRLDMVHDLGTLYTKQGNLDRAEEMFLRALAGGTNAQLRSTLETADGLGCLYAMQGKLAQAEPIFSLALAGKEQTLGSDHRSTLETVHNLGAMFTKQGKLTQAEEMYVRALAGRENTLGPEHNSTLTTISNLGNVYTRQGKLAQAEQMYVRALAGRELALGSDNISTLQTALNMGALFYEQGRLAQAEEMFVRALAGMEKMLGPKHNTTLHAINNLGALFTQQGKLAKAEEMYLRALAAYEQTAGSDHQLLDFTVKNLGFIYLKQGRPEEVERIFLRAEGAGYILQDNSSS